MVEAYYKEQADCKIVVVDDDNDAEMSKLKARINEGQPDVEDHKIDGEAKEITMHDLRVSIKKNKSDLEIVSEDEIQHSVFLKNTSKEMLQSKIGRRFYPEIISMCFIGTCGLIYCQESNLNYDQTLTLKSCREKNKDDENYIELLPFMIGLVVYHSF
jgi:hypothetical protein